MKNVVIMGGGIGGLAAAHYFSQDNEYHITIIERNNEVGGLARASIVNDSYQEYCWHAVCINYLYFLEIMRDLVDNEGYSLLSYLKPLNNFIYSINGKYIEEKDNSFITRGYWDAIKILQFLYDEVISVRDTIYLILLLIYGTLIGNQRFKWHDADKWQSFFNVKSAMLKRWIVDSSSIYLGMEYNKISTHFMLNILRNVKDDSPLLDGKYRFYSFSETMKNILHIWTDNLKRKNVNIILNAEIVKLDYVFSENRIQAIEYVQGNEVKTIKADIVICSLDANNLSKLYPLANNFSMLYKLGGTQIQTQVLFHTKKVLDTKLNTVAVNPDSPWFLMTRFEGNLWDLKEEEYLSVGIGIWDVEGEYVKKRAINCTKEELATECWYQLSKSFKNLKFSNKIPKWTIWNSFKFNKDRLTTYEPKFSNNVNTLRYRPRFKDLINNLYHASSITLTTENIYNMESACEAANKVYQIVKHGSFTEHKNIKKISWIVSIFRYLDDILFEYI